MDEVDDDILMIAVKAANELLERVAVLEFDRDMLSRKVVLLQARVRRLEER